LGQEISKKTGGGGVFGKKTQFMFHPFFEGFQGGGGGGPLEALDKKRFRSGGFPGGTLGFGGGVEFLKHWHSRQTFTLA